MVKVSGVPSGSLAEIGTVTVSFSLLVRSGLKIVGDRFSSVTVQINVVWTIAVPSLTVTTTLWTPEDERSNVPEMTPVFASIDMPEGRPVAL